MGKQQLILATLVLIIVAVATVIAFNIFNKAAEKSNIDAVNKEFSMLVSSAQSYYLKPEMLGGGGQSFQGVTFNDISFPSNGIGESGLIAESKNGRYIITEDQQGLLTITAHPASCKGFIPGTHDSDGNFTIESASGCENTLVATIEPNNFLLTSTASVQ